jgi:hypothetical protein
LADILLVAVPALAALAGLGVFLRSRRGSPGRASPRRRTAATLREPLPPYVPTWRPAAPVVSIDAHRRSALALDRARRTHRGP